MDKLNSINHALDQAIIEMLENLPHQTQYSVALPDPLSDFLALTPSTTHYYLPGARNALSLRTPASASRIHLAAARDEICRSRNPPPPAPLPPSPVLRPVATRPPCVSRDTSPPCEYKIQVTELQRIRCCLDHCMLLRQVHRKDAKSGQRRLNFLLCKTAEKDDKRLWGPTWKEMGFVKKSQGQLEMCELEILRLKAREREAIAAIEEAEAEVKKMGRKLREWRIREKKERWRNEWM